MKKFILLTVISHLTLSSVYSQKLSFHSIQEVLTYHIEQLKSTIGHYDHIFIETRLDDTINLPSKVLRIENDGEAKFLNSRDENFLVEVRIATQVNYIKINLINYRVIKLSNKKIKLLNLSNGSTYAIINKAP